MTPVARKPPLERFLSLFAEVRPGEAITALLLTSSVFLILASYYGIKPVREALSRLDFIPRDSKPDRTWYKAMYGARAGMERRNGAAI